MGLDGAESFHGGLLLWSGSLCALAFFGFPDGCFFFFFKMRFGYSRYFRAFSCNIFITIYIIIL